MSLMISMSYHLHLYFGSDGHMGSQQCSVARSGSCRPWPHPTKRGRGAMCPSETWRKWGSMKSWAKSLKLTQKHMERHSKPLWGLLNLLVVLGERRFREHVAGVFNLGPAQRFSVQVKAGRPIARCMHLGTGFPKNWPDTAGLATNHCWQNNDHRGWDCQWRWNRCKGVLEPCYPCDITGWCSWQKGDVSYCQVGPPVYVRNRRCQLEVFRPRELSPIPLAVLHQIPLTSHALSCSAPKETYLKRLDKFLMKLGPGGWQNLWQFHGTSCNEIDQDISTFSMLRCTCLKVDPSLCSPTGLVKLHGHGWADGRGSHRCL